MWLGKGRPPRGRLWLGPTTQETRSGGVAEPVQHQELEEGVARALRPETTLDELLPARSRPSGLEELREWILRNGAALQM